MLMVGMPHDRCAVPGKGRAPWAGQPPGKKARMMSERAVSEKKVSRKTVRSASKSDTTRERILDAAALVFGRKGFAGARLSDIARVADLQTGSLYYHFDSREELVAEVMTLGVNHVFQTVQKAIDALAPDVSPVERLKVALEAHLQCLLERSDYARAVSKLAGQVPSNIQVLHMANEEAYGRLWKRLLKEARDSADIRGDLNMSAVRMLMLGAMAWAVEWYRPENGSAASLAHDFSEMVLNGLVPR